MKKQFKWTQPSSKKWIVETDQIKGIVVTLNENGEEIQRREGLRPLVVQLIEEQFMSVVGERVNADDEAFKNMMYM